MPFYKSYNIEILNTEVDGNKAVIKTKGTRGSEVSDGTINMVKEDGAWKVGP